MSNDNSITNNKLNMTVKSPLLKGYTYLPYESFQAREEGRLLSLRLETNTACNLSCRYCYADSGKKNLEADPDFLKNIIGQAASLGARSVVVIGGGEPTLYRGFSDLIAFIFKMGMIPVVFTNGINVDQQLAEFLFEHQASVIIKCDSFSSDIQDFLAGRKGSSRMIMKGFYSLQKAGFTKTESRLNLRLGISFVTNKLNLGEAPLLWEYCRQHSIFPNMEILTPTGRAKENLKHLLLSDDEIKEFKTCLLEIDQQKYGYGWLVYTPLPGSGCLQHLYSMYVTITGDVRPCAPCKFDENPSLHEDGKYPYNLNTMNLDQIYHSGLFHYARYIDQKIKGNCAACEFSNECIGCRGYAYSEGVNRGLNPFDALSQECPQCFK